MKEKQSIDRPKPRVTVLSWIIAGAAFAWLLFLLAGATKGAYWLIFLL